MQARKGGGGERGDYPSWIDGPRTTGTSRRHPSRYKAASDIQSLAVEVTCPTEQLSLTTEKALIALDASTGAELWTLTNLPSPSFRHGCRATIGLSYRKDKIVAFDLRSGHQLWDASTLGAFKEIRGFEAFWSDDLLLIILRTAASDRSVAAVRLSTGELLWQRDDLLSRSLRFAVRDGVSDITEDQVVKDTDTTLIWSVSPDGPVRLDRRSGATLWKGGALPGQPVPTERHHASIKLVNSVLVIPRDSGLVALDVRDGRVLWESASLPTHATTLATVPSGLLVRAGDAYVTVLNPTTGTPRWAVPFTAPMDGTQYVIVSDRYYVVTRGRLLVLDLATGDTTGLADLVFNGSDHAQGIRATDEGVLVLGFQNLFAVGLQGGLRYHRYYESPGPTALQILANAGFAAPAAPTYVYFYTNTPDSAGRTGKSFVRVSLRDGNETGRIWFRPALEWLFDNARDQLLVLEDIRTLVAVRFPVGPGGEGRQP